ncbi:hypothetical protein PS907_00167 [Pseudomonas fluorescens]|nr:hypothetical protein PS907_00167 [Pseudomonas fluorescens]
MTIPDRLAMVTAMVKGTPYVIVDICLRMLKPAELYKAQGFPADYIISYGADGKLFTKTQQVHMCGNSVSPPPMAALAHVMTRGAPPNGKRKPHDLKVFSSVSSQVRLKANRRPCYQFHTDEILKVNAKRCDDFSQVLFKIQVPLMDQYKLEMKICRRNC